MDETWKRAVVTLGAAAAVAVVVRSMARSASEAKPNTTRAAATSAVRATAPAAPVKDPEAINKYMQATCTKFADLPKDSIENIGDLSKFLAFKSEYKTRFTARPDVADGELLRITDWKLLTPEDYDRTCFHIEMDISGTSMEHTVNGSQGKALSVYATNDAAMVKKFIQEVGLDPHAIVSVEEIAPPEEEGVTVLTSVEKLFMNYLDIFGRPTREFLKKLFTLAVDIQEKVQIAELTLERKMEEFQDRTARGYTFADYITEFKSLRIPAEKYVELIPTIKQRVYSICSSSDYRPGKCQLLVVREDWETKDGKTKYGLCSGYMTNLRAGNFAVCHATHSVMQMPDDNMAHIFMAGLGTGLAPFRAFVEQRAHQKKKQGINVGPMTLFFGGRYSKSEYYYRDEFEAFEAEGLVKCCNAWSRDQKHKIYVQHKITEEADTIWQQLGKEGSKGYFFLCGSKQPEKDVFCALLDILQKKGGMSLAQAQKKMEQLQADGRYVTEVY